MSILGKTTLLVNIFAAIALLISYSAPLVSPAIFWPIAFFGLAYPVTLIFNLFFVLIWLFSRNKKFIFISLICILIGWNNLSNLYSIGFNNTTNTEDYCIKILSYNVNVFGFNKFKNAYQKRNNMLNMIKHESPDILCLQEFVHYPDDEELDNIKKTLEILKDYDYYVEYLTTSKKRYNTGNIIFSRYPIIDKGKVIVNSRYDHFCIYVDLKINHDTIRVYNVHLQSIYMNMSDYKFAKDLIKGGGIDENDELKKGSKRIINRLKSAFIKRAPQAENIAKSVQESHYPVVLCGDFNDTPSSYAYNTLAMKLSDAFIENGEGSGHTYIGIFPSFRIDYILKSNEIKSYDFTIIDLEESDHNPVTCCFTID